MTSLSSSSFPFINQVGMHNVIYVNRQSIYIKLPRLSVCVSVFRISEKRADRFP